MASLTPVLYIEETRDDGNKDWHMCIRYLGEDKYMVYGYRYNYGNDFYSKMTFLNRKSLMKFLRLSYCTETSVMDVTLYFVNRHSLDNDDFESYYNAYKYSNDLVGYDGHSFNEEGLMDMLRILRDMRM
jgi:hypothetical protein